MTNTTASINTTGATMAYVCIGDTLKVKLEPQSVFIDEAETLDGIKWPLPVFGRERWYFNGYDLTNRRRVKRENIKSGNLYMDGTKPIRKARGWRRHVRKAKAKL